MQSIAHYKIAFCAVTFRLGIIQPRVAWFSRVPTAVPAGYHNGWVNNRTCYKLGGSATACFQWVWFPRIANLVQ